MLIYHEKILLKLIEYLKVSFHNLFFKLLVELTTLKLFELL